MTLFISVKMLRLCILLRLPEKREWFRHAVPKQDTVVLYCINIYRLSSDLVWQQWGSYLSNWREVLLWNFSLIKSKVFRFGIALSDCNVILVFNLQNQRQKSFLRAMASMRLFYDFPSKSVYWGKKCSAEGSTIRRNQHILSQKSFSRQMNVEQVKT